MCIARTAWVGKHSTRKVCVSRTARLSHHVRNPYINRMTRLQQWMTKNRKLDAEVARAVKRSRPQISRIRRGITAASVPTAHRLETLTGVKWWHFVAGEKRLSRRGV